MPSIVLYSPPRFPACAGIFVLTGIAAGGAGPALILAFALNGLVALLTAMSYAELGFAAYFDHVLNQFGVTLPEGGSSPPRNFWPSPSR